MAGPTASGKTRLAVTLAKIFNTEIISADSRQFYKEIPIGTAAPEKSILALVPHHLVGHLSIFDEYNVSKFEQEVLKLLDIAFHDHPVMILTGGSGLYIDSVCDGIDELPDADLEIRKQLEKKYQDSGIEELQKQLSQLDAEYYDVVDKNNPKRLIRALEVCLQTGYKYSKLRKRKKKDRDFRILKIGIELPRAVLYERINLRCEEMLAKGWIDEAKAVFPFRNLNSLNTVGYKELFNYFDGKMSLEDTIEKIKTNTRRYAKRQLIWFKKDPTYTWFSPEDEKGIIRFLRNKGLS